MKHAQLALAIALFGCIGLQGIPLRAQEAARSQTVKEDDYPIIDCILFAFGPQTFSENVEETLKNGVRGYFAEINVALPVLVNLFRSSDDKDRHHSYGYLRRLRIGIIPMDICSHDYLLTPSEKAAISRYEIVTYTGYGDFKTEESREPLKDISAFSQRLSFIARLYPLSKGISPPSMKADIQPFIGAGTTYHSLTDNLPAGAEGITTEEGSGFSTFLNVGMDLVWNNVFLIRIEYLKGSLPDWSVQLLPELRPIEGGDYSIFKIGVGAQISKGLLD